MKWNFLPLWRMKILKRRKFLTFQETELSYISGKGNPKKLLTFKEVTFQARKIKKIHSEKFLIFLIFLIFLNFLYFRKRKPRKNFLYFLKRKLFLYFGKDKLYVFQETELSCISGNNFLSSKNEKKKNTLLIFQKKLLIFQKMWLYSSKKLNKTLLGETGCLSNH